MTSEDAAASAPATGPAGTPASAPAPLPPRRLSTFPVVAVGVLVVDQLTKALALARLQPGEPVPLVGELLQLRLTFNPGAAFSLAEGYTIVLSLIAIGVVVAVLRVSRRLRSRGWAIALGALLGGAVGNLTDRVFREPAPLRGYVVDFLELPHWPIFNVADSCVVTGAVLMVLLSLRGVEYDGRSRR